MQKSNQYFDHELVKMFIHDFIQIRYMVGGYLYSLLRPFVSLSQAVNIFIDGQTYIQTQGVCVLLKNSQAAAPCWPLHVCRLFVEV